MEISTNAYVLISLFTLVPLITVLLLGMRIGSIVYLSAFIAFFALLFSYWIFRFTSSQFEIIGLIFIGIIALNYIIGISLRFFELKNKWASRSRQQWYSDACGNTNPCNIQLYHLEPGNTPGLIMQPATPSPYQHPAWPV